MSNLEKGKKISTLKQILEGTNVGLGFDNSTPKKTKYIFWYRQEEEQAAESLTVDGYRAAVLVARGILLAKKAKFPY